VTLRLPPPPHSPLAFVDARKRRTGGNWLHELIADLLLLQYLVSRTYHYHLLTRVDERLARLAVNRRSRELPSGKENLTPESSRFSNPPCFSSPDKSFHRSPQVSVFSFFSSNSPTFPPRQRFPANLDEKYLRVLRERIIFLRDTLPILGGEGDNCARCPRGVCV